MYFIIKISNDCRFGAVFSVSNFLWSHILFFFFSCFNQNYLLSGTTFSQRIMRKVIFKTSFHIHVSMVFRSSSEKHALTKLSPQGTLLASLSFSFTFFLYNGPNSQVIEQLWISSLTKELYKNIIPLTYIYQMPNMCEVLRTETWWL